jgi:hypothetical protein
MGKIPFEDITRIIELRTGISAFCLFFRFFYRVFAFLYLDDKNFKSGLPECRPLVESSISALITTKEHYTALGL